VLDQVTASCRALCLWSGSTGSSVLLAQVLVLRVLRVLRELTADRLLETFQTAGNNYLNNISAYLV
jgi:hypothetical protein